MALYSVKVTLYVQIPITDDELWWEDLLDGGFTVLAILLSV